MADAGSKPVKVAAPAHHQQLINRLWFFFLTIRHVDMTFLSAGRPISVHQIVVMAFLPPQRLVEYGRRHPHRSLDRLVAFLYRGWIAVPEQELSDLLDTARELDFQLLVDAVRQASGSKPTVVISFHHHEILAAGLWHFAKIGFGTDTTVTCAGRQLQLHSLVVESFLTIDTLTNDHWPVLLDYLAAFLYLGTVTVPEYLLTSLLDAGRALGFKLLADAITSTMEEQGGHSIRIVDAWSCAEAWPDDASGTRPASGDESDSSGSDSDFIDVETVTPPASPDRISSRHAGLLDAGSKSDNQLPNLPELLKNSAIKTPLPERNTGSCVSGTNPTESNVHSTSGESDVALVDISDATADPFTSETRLDHTYPVRRLPDPRYRKAHRANAHQYVCDVCQLRFHRFSQHQVHRLVHLPLRPHQCSQCDWSFDKQHKLLRHMLVHGDVAYQCRVCRKPFRRVDGLKKHEELCHPADLQEEVASQMAKQVDERKYRCRLCGVEFACRREFNRHSQSQAHREKLPSSGIYRCLA